MTAEAAKTPGKGRREYCDLRARRRPRSTARSARCGHPVDAAPLRHSILCTASGGLAKSKSESIISTSTFRFAGCVSCIESSCTSQFGSPVRQPQYEKFIRVGSVGELHVSWRSTRDPAFGSIRLLELSLDASLICRLDGEAYKHFHLFSRQFSMLKGKSYG